ncbi:MAG TPA: SGNH/GDSL hydrolase family protein [Fibrobacteria bacterium]|nr:SGNH/GDSL hydrolase family protein [Fibrobacteria bacterium]
MVLSLGVGSGALAQTKVKASDLVVNGESFFAASNITSELTRLARADGYMGNTESFRQIAVSGAVMSGILNQYKNSNPKPIYLISDGGGNDIMGSCGSNPSIECLSIKNALNLVRQYFTQMKTSGTRKVLWMRYPDPIGTQWANLKTNQDLYNPEVEKICKASIEPQCLWVDLRPVWAGKYSQYTSDGIHCTNAGGTATAEAFWKAIKENDFFNLGASTSVAEAGPRGASFLRGTTVVNRSLVLSLTLDQTLPLTLRIRTVSGQTVLDAHSEARSTAVAGLAAAEFPLGTLKPGVYTLDVRAGRFTGSSIFLMP